MNIFSLSPEEAEKELDKIFNSMSDEQFINDLIDSGVKIHRKENKIIQSSDSSQQVYEYPLHTLLLTVIFKLDQSTTEISEISYEIYLSEDGVVDVSEINASGEHILVRMYKTADFFEGFSLVRSILKLDYRQFKEKVLKPVRNNKSFIDDLI